VAKTTDAESLTTREALANEEVTETLLGRLTGPDHALAQGTATREVQGLTFAASASLLSWSSDAAKMIDPEIRTRKRKKRREETIETKTTTSAASGSTTDVKVEKAESRRANRSLGIRSSIRARE